MRHPVAAVSSWLSKEVTPMSGGIGTPVFYHASNIREPRWKAILNALLLLGPMLGVGALLLCMVVVLVLDATHVIDICPLLESVRGAPCVHA